MKILIACEESGVVRRAFRALGHDAWSCDILPARDGSPYHYQCDVREVLGQNWDLLIAHPPCDYLANSGVQWLTRTPKNPNPKVLYGEARRAAMHEAAEFFLLFHRCDHIPRVCIENPIMHRDARAAVEAPYTQIVQPFQFGHGETKATCLWLKGLPKLTPTKLMPPPYVGRVHKEAPGPLRKLRRSETYTGIAEAMAAQWGAL